MIRWRLECLVIGSVPRLLDEYGELSNRDFVPADVERREIQRRLRTCAWPPLVVEGQWIDRGVTSHQERARPEPQRNRGASSSGRNHASERKPARSPRLDRKPGKALHVARRFELRPLERHPYCDAQYRQRARTRFRPIEGARGPTRTLPYGSCRDSSLSLTVTAPASPQAKVQP